MVSSLFGAPGAQGTNQLTTETAEPAECALREPGFGVFGAFGG
jgi:hypothetical protein